MAKKTFALAIVLEVFFCGHLWARHLENRTGLGVTLHDFDSTPAISLRYHMSNYQSAVLLAGFNSDDAHKSFVVGGKLYQNAYLEENINFYVGVGGFVIGDKGSYPSSATGIELNGFFGAEFFLPGLQNLGIMFETGVAVRTLREVSIATLGNGFLGAAVHYYF